MAGIDFWHDPEDIQARAVPEPLIPEVGLEGTYYPLSHACFTDGETEAWKGEKTHRRACGNQN